MTTSGRQRRSIPVPTRLGRSTTPVSRPEVAATAETHFRLIEHNGLRWYDIRRPTGADIEYLRAEYEFHPLALDDVTSRSQRPKLDIFDDYLFIVMHFPVHNKAARKTIASEVDIFVGPNYLITAHDGHLKPLVRMFDSALESESTRESLMNLTSAHLLYYVIDRLVDYTFPIVTRLTERIETIEDTMFTSTGLDVVQEISIVRRDLIALRRIMKPQLAVVSQLEHRDLPVIRSDIEVYFGDIVDHLAKIWDSLEDLKEVLEGLSDTYDSLATHRLNGVIKTLTVISVIILPLTLITGIFGMNVPLPYDESPYALAVIVGSFIILSTAMLLVFRKRGWI